MADFDKFRNTTEKLDHWLGQLYGIMLDLQKEALKGRGLKLDDSAKTSISVPLSALIDSTSQLRRLLEDQKESLTILRRSPPGMTASIIDFLHNIVVDPRSPSQKEEHYNRLKKLDDSNMNKQFDTVSSALGAPKAAISGKILEQVKSSIQKWSQGTSILKPNFQMGSPESQKLEAQLVEKTKYVVSFMLSEIPIDFPQNLKPEIEDLLRVFLEGFANKELVGPEFKVFMSNLKTRLAQISSSAKKENLENGFKNIDATLAGIFAKPEQKGFSNKLIIYSEDQSATISRFITILRQYEQMLVPFLQVAENQSFVKEIDQLLGELGNNANKKDIDLAQKYHNYVKGLLGAESRHGVVYYLNSIKVNIEDIIKTLKEKTLSEPEAPSIEPVLNNSNTPSPQPSESKQSEPHHNID